MMGGWTERAASMNSAFLCDLCGSILFVGEPSVLNRGERGATQRKDHRTQRSSATSAVQFFSLESPPFLTAENAEKRREKTPSLSVPLRALRLNLPSYSENGIRISKAKLRGKRQFTPGSKDVPSVSFVPHMLIRYSDLFSRRDTFGTCFVRPGGFVLRI